MGFNSVFKGLKIVKNPGKGRLNSLNDPVPNVLTVKDSTGKITCAVCLLRSLRFVRFEVF